MSELERWNTHLSTYVEIPLFGYGSGLCFVLELCRKWSSECVRPACRSEVRLSQNPSSMNLGTTGARVRYVYFWAVCTLAIVVMVGNASAVWDASICLAKYLEKVGAYLLRILYACHAWWLVQLKYACCHSILLPACAALAEG